MKPFAIISALLAFVFCLAGGYVILHGIGFELFGNANKDTSLQAGIGLYFIGKAVFVAAIILLTVFETKRAQ